MSKIIKTTPEKRNSMLESGLIYIPNDLPKKRMPRKWKKQYTKYVGPNAYRKFLKGVPRLLIKSDYINVNGCTLAPWNKKETRKFEFNFNPKQGLKGRYAKKLVNSKFYETINVNGLKNE